MGSSSASVSPPCFSSLVVNETLTLIPGLPNDVSAMILIHLPFSHQARLRSTCKSWRSFLSSKSLISLRRLQLPPSRLAHLLCIFPQDPFIAPPILFDPRALAWRLLPTLPCDPHVYSLCNFASIALGTCIYVIGGSLFDTRSYPMDRPCPSSSAFRLDLLSSSWDRISPMLSPRGSFACAVMPSLGQIVVAGGGSRHTMFGAAGSRMSSVERYDVARDEWVALDGLPRFRAGCTGFVVGNASQKDFWVMGGYGESRTVSRMLPVDRYYRDVVVMESRNSGKWREVGDMWEEGERTRLGKIVVVEDDDDCGVSDIFMLDGKEILRYDMSINRWHKESRVPRKTPNIADFGFVALDGELHVMTLLNGAEAAETGRPRHQKRSSPMLLMQIYHPRNKAWRSVITKLPFFHQQGDLLKLPSLQQLDLKPAIMCTIRL